MDDTTQQQHDGEPAGADGHGMLEHVSPTVWAQLDEDFLHDALQVYVPTAANIPDKFYTATVDARMAVLRRIAASRGTAAAGPP